MIIKEKTILKQEQLCVCGSGKDTQICCSYEEIFNNIKSIITSPNLDVTDFSTAEELCQKLLMINSSDLRIYQALFFIYSKNNNPEQAIIALKKITTLIDSPIRLSQCFSDMGSMLNNLGKLVEAEEALKKSIELNESYALAYYNLGILYMAQNKNEQAIDNYKLAIKLDPSMIQSYNNLTRLLVDDPKNLQEALYYQQKAVELSPNTESLIYNLGITLSVAGNFVEAKLAFEKSLALLPEKWESFEKLLDCIFFISNHAELFTRIKDVFIKADNIPIITQKRMYFLLYLVSFLQEDYINCDKYLNKSFSLSELPDEDKKIRAIKIFHNYLRLLVLYHHENPLIYEQLYDDRIYIIGESHCLAAAHLVIALDNKKYKITPQIITGCKIWHLTSPYDNSYKAAFNILLNKITAHSSIIVCFGEIDCRINEGIMSFYRKNPDTDIEAHISKMVIQYISLLKKYTEEKQKFYNEVQHREI